MEEVEPFLIKTVEPYNPNEKSELKFKKGQTITVEKIDTSKDLYFGFYDGGKKEGWFPDFYATKIKGGTPEVRKYNLQKSTTADEPSKKDKGEGLKGSLSNKKNNKASDSKILAKASPVAETDATNAVGAGGPNPSRGDSNMKDSGNSSKISTSSVQIPPESENNNNPSPSLVDAEDLSKSNRKQLEKEKRAQQAQQKKQAKEAKKQEKILKKETKKKRTMTKKEGANYAAENNAPTIPPIVEDTIIFLEQEDRLRQEGIFRVSGSLNDVKAIKESYSKNKPVDLTKIHDPHTVAGVLKIYFRESKNPLLTFEFYPLWIQTMAEGAEDARSLTIKIRRVLRRLPDLNQIILKRLMGLLSKVAANADKNLMNVNNIAIVFAPTLLRPPGEAIDLAIQHSAYSNNLVKFIIENYNMVFSEERLDGEEGEESNGGNAAGTTQDGGDHFEKELKRGSLALARGSFIAPQRPADLERIVREEDEKAAAQANNNNAPAPSNNSTQNDETEESKDEDTEEGSDPENDKEPEKKSVRALTMSQMMDMILEGEVTEVNQYLASLDQVKAASISQQLLTAIDEALQNT